MSNRSFFIAGNTAAVVANDDSDFRYRAAIEILPVGVIGQPHTDERFETQFLVETGSVEFMIGGGTAIVLESDFVRVPAGVVHAMRNAGHVTARVMVRRVSPAGARRACAVLVDFAA